MIKYNTFFTDLENGNCLYRVEAMVNGINTNVSVDSRIEYDPEKKSRERCVLIYESMLKRQAKQLLIEEIARIVIEAID